MLRGNGRRPRQGERLSRTSFKALPPASGICGTIHTFSVMQITQKQTKIVDVSVILCHSVQQEVHAVPAMRAHPRPADPVSLPAVHQVGASTLFISKAFV